MNLDRRVASGILGGLSIALASLMIYVFVAEHAADWSGDDPSEVEAVDVSVFFPDRIEWRIFRRGLEECLSPRGLGRVMLENDETVVIETPRRRRHARFTWHNARGETETRAEARQTNEGPNPPIAFVGSSNSVLTSALAEQLSIDLDNRRGVGPILLVPWATSARILQSYPGRSFRLCSNNRRAAETLLECMAEKAVRKPNRVLLLMDDHDPYSIDLGACLEDLIKSSYPKAKLQILSSVFEVSVHAPASRGAIVSTPREQEFARSVWSSVAAAPDEAAWMFLPVQNEPARRILSALGATAPADSDRGGLTVICGDAVGQTTYESMLNALSFPVWGLSNASNLAFATRIGLDDDVQLLGEVSLALLVLLDQMERASADELRGGLLKLHIRAGDPRSLGRPLAFQVSGERAWESHDDVLHIRPRERVVLHSTRDARGGWSDPRPIEPDGGRTP